MGTPHDQLLQKISRLSPERVAEVEDFVDFIAQRDTDRELVQSAARASEAAFSKPGAIPKTTSTTGQLESPTALRFGT